MPNLRKRSQRFPNPLKVEVNKPSTFQRDGRLHALAECVHVRHQIEATVRSHLEPALREHLHGVTLREGVLSLSFDSAAFSARLRYRTEDLGRKLRRHAELEHLTSIRCIVRPPIAHALQRKRGRDKRRLSPSTALMLQESAANFSDSEIREAIQRLADLASGNGPPTSKPG